MFRKMLTAGALIAPLVVGAQGAPTAANAETPVLTPADSAPCQDPWINYAYRTAIGRRPNGVAGAGECTIGLYAGGRWSNYDQLKAAVIGYVQSSQRPPTPAPAPPPVVQTGNPPFNKAGFNFNVPACPQAPQYASLRVVTVDVFSDGSPLPSCGGQDAATRFKMVWTGVNWAKFGPSIQSVVVAPPPPQPQPAPRPNPTPAPIPTPTPPPQPQPQPSTDPATAPIAGAITQEQLPGAPEIQQTLNLGLAYAQNIRSLASAFQAASTGPDPLYDPAVVQDVNGVANYIQFLMNGPNNPYSLQKQVSGGIVALNDDEKTLLALLLASDPEIAQLAQENRELASLLPTIATQRGGMSRVFYWGEETSNRNFIQRVALVNDDLNFPAVHNFDQPLNLTGLDRANTLAATLAWGQRLGTASTAMTAGLQVESQVTAVVNRLAAQVFRGGQVYIGEIGRVVKIYAAVKLTVQLTNAAVNAMFAVTPSSISNVYMNLGQRAYQPNLPPWPLAVGQTVNAQIYVVPHTAGGNIVSPLGAISLVIDAGLGPSFSSKFQAVMRNTQVARQMEETFKKYVELAGKYQVDAILTYFGNYNSSALAGWVKWAQDTPISINPRDLRPIEVNDARLIRIVYNTSMIDVSQGPDHRFIVKGVAPGTSSLVGTLNNKVPALIRGPNGGAAGATSFTIAIQVNGAPSGPPYQPCGKPGDGGMMVNGKCSYPTGA